VSRFAIPHHGERRLRAPVVGAIVLAVLVVGTASAAVAGDPLKVGVLNTINALTRWTGSATTSILRLTNTGSGTALDLHVAAGVAPMLVSSSTKVANLNADLIDGVDSTALQRVLTAGCPGSDLLKSVAPNGTPTCAHPDGGNAQLLDGTDSADFIHGRGTVVGAARALQPDGSLSYVVMQTTNPSFRVAYNCPNNLTTNGVLVFINDNAELVNVFWDNGTADPEYMQLAANGGRHDVFASPNGEHYTIQVQGSQITTFEIFSTHRPSDCHIQAQAVITR
jgi:hypothetical protein